MQRSNSDKEQQYAIGLECTTYGRGNSHCCENLVIDTLKRWSLREHRVCRPNNARIVRHRGSKEMQRMETRKKLKQLV